MSFRNNENRLDIGNFRAPLSTDFSGDNSAIISIYKQLKLGSACIYIDDSVRISVAASINAPATGSVWNIESFDNPWVMRRPRISSVFHRTTAYVDSDTWSTCAARAELQAFNGEVPTYGLLSSTHTGLGELVVLFSRSQRRGEFLAAEMELANHALPAIVQICLLGRQLNQTLADLELHEGALDALSLALIRVNEEGEVTYQNKSATDVLNGAGTAADWRLRAQPGKWSDAMTSVANGAARGFSGTAGDGTAMHLPAKVLRTRIGECQYLLGYNDEKTRATAVRGHLAGKFGLSPTELGLAIGLLEGRSLAEIADARGASINTIRVHLRNALKKTGQARQAALVAMMARIPALRAD